jgi:hypothetical protein
MYFIRLNSQFANNDSKVTRRIGKSASQNSLADCSKLHGVARAVQPRMGIVAVSHFFRDSQSA